MNPCVCVSETDEFLVEMDEDVEGMQGTILALQQQLKEARQELSRLQQDYTALQGSVRTAYPVINIEPEQPTNPVTSSNGAERTAGRGGPEHGQGHSSKPDQNSTGADSSSNGRQEGMDTSEALAFDSEVSRRKLRTRHDSGSSTEHLDSKGSINGLPQPDSIDEDSLSNS